MDSPYDIEAMAKRQNPIDWHGRYLAEKARAETAEAERDKFGGMLQAIEEILEGPDNDEIAQSYDPWLSFPLVRAVFDAKVQLAETQAVVREVAESLCADDSEWERDPKVAKLRAVLPEAMESR